MRTRAASFALYGGQSLHTAPTAKHSSRCCKTASATGFSCLTNPSPRSRPQRQLSLLGVMHDLVKTGRSQSDRHPLADPQLRLTTLEETAHHQITRGVLERPASYLEALDGLDYAAHILRIFYEPLLRTQIREPTFVHPLDRVRGRTLRLGRETAMETRLARLRAAGLLAKPRSVARTGLAAFRRASH